MRTLTALKNLGIAMYNDTQDLAAILIIGIILVLVVAGAGR